MYLFFFLNIFNLIYSSNSNWNNFSYFNKNLIDINNNEQLDFNNDTLNIIDFIKKQCHLLSFMSFGDAKSSENKEIQDQLFLLIVLSKQNQFGFDSLLDDLCSLINNSNRNINNKSSKYLIPFYSIMKSVYNEEK